jgi:hypothetical protein
VLDRVKFFIFFSGLSRSEKFGLGNLPKLLDRREKGDDGGAGEGKTFCVSLRVELNKDEHHKLCVDTDITWKLCDTPN